MTFASGNWSRTPWSRACRPRPPARMTRNSFRTSASAGSGSAGSRPCSMTSSPSPARRRTASARRARGRAATSRRSPATRCRPSSARGGMGVVYRARHVQLNRTVALKMIAGRATMPGRRGARFRARGRGRGGPAAPQHRAGLRRRRLRRPALLHAWSSSRGAASPSGSRPPWPAAAGRRAGGHAGRGREHAHRARDRPPRPQAGQCPARPPTARPRSATSAWPGRLEAGPATHDSGARRRHAELHGPRAGPGPAAARSARRRRLRAGRHPLRAADRPAAVPGGHGRGDAAAGRRRRARRRPRGSTRRCRATWRRSA